jgi:exonuclease VII large subunit
MDKQKTEIAKLLKQKQKTCARLLEKMDEQMEAIRSQDNSRLALIIEVKEELVVGLNETDQKIADLAKRLSETAQELLVNENEELGKRIESDLEKIIEQETICQKKLDLVKSELLEKLKALKKGQILLKGYGVSQRIKQKISKNV